MVRYGARLFSRNFLGLVTFYVQLITNILKQLIFDLSDFPHLLLNISLYGRSIASVRIRNFLVLEYGRVTDKKKKEEKKQSGDEFTFC